MQAPKLRTLQTRSNKYFQIKEIMYICMLRSYSHKKKEEKNELNVKA